MSRRASIGVWLAFLLLHCTRPTSRTPPAPGAPSGSWGSAMADVARRYELLGRAAEGGRLELARYELGEIDEVFRNVLPSSARPKEGHPEVLPALAQAFVATQLPELKRALDATDGGSHASAFASTAAACNGCHQASGHGFIVVPAVEGQPIPETSALAR